MKSSLSHQLKEVNRELWLILSLFVIAALLNSLITVHRMVLGFYVLPTLLAAFAGGQMEVPGLVV